MTYPQGGTPENAANYESLAAFAAKTQEEWEAELRGEQRQPWDFMLDGFFEELQQGQGYAVAIMGAIADGLGLGPVWNTTTEVVEALSNWVIDVVTDAVALADQIIASIIEAITGSGTSDLGVLEEWADDVWALGEDAAEFAQDSVDALVQGFHGWIGNLTRTGFPAEDLQQVGIAIGAVVGELNSVTMKVDELAGQVAAAIENFASSVQNVLSMGQDWFQYYLGSGGGTLGIQNGYAVFQAAADTVNKVAVSVNKALTTGDFQAVSAIISKPITDAGQAVNTILARVDPTKVNSDNVFAKMTDATATIGYVKNGVTTVLGEVQNVLKNGSKYTLEAGVGGSANTFRLLEGSKEILKVTDSLAASSIGAAFRGSGIATLAPNPKARPGLFAAFSAFAR